MATLSHRGPEDGNKRNKRLMLNTSTLVHFILLLLNAESSLMSILPIKAQVKNAKVKIWQLREVEMHELATKGEEVGASEWRLTGKLSSQGGTDTHRHPSSSYTSSSCYSSSPYSPRSCSSSYFSYFFLFVLTPTRLPRLLLLDTT